MSGGVVAFKSANQRSVDELIDLISENRDEIKNLVILTVDKDKETNIFFSPIEAAIFAYLCKQMDAEFMSQFLFNDPMEVEE